MGRTDKSYFLKSDDNTDKRISIALLASSVVLTIQYFILISFNIIETSNSIIIQQASKVIVGVAFLYALPSVLRRSKVKIFSIYFITIFIYIIHYGIFPENRFFIIDLSLSTFFMCLPAFVYSISIINWLILKDVMKKASYIIYVVGVFIGGLVFLGKVSIGTYSMSLSYYLLMPAIIFLDELIDRFSLKMLVFSLTTLLVILAIGSRGAIVCIIVFVFLKLVRHKKEISYKKALVDSFLLGLMVFTCIYLEIILESLYSLLSLFGIKSRSIILFMRDEIHLSGRERLYKAAIDEITKSPLIGFGLGGDRRILNGGYVHNFILEVVGNFGFVIGLIFLLLLLIIILKSLVSKNGVKYNIIIMWMCLGFIHLMFSGSYIINIKFWIFLGLLLNPYKGLNYGRKS